MHSLVEIYETHFLSLVSPWLDNNYHKQTKVLQYREIFASSTKHGHSSKQKI